LFGQLNAIDDMNKITPIVENPSPIHNLINARRDAPFHSPKQIDQVIPVATEVVMTVGQAILAANFFGNKTLAESPYV
jgi:hypothetical protein